MRLVSYRDRGEPGVGVMVDDTGLVALPKVAPDLPRGLRGILELGEAGLRRTRAAAAGRARSGVSPSTSGGTSRRRG